MLQIINNEITAYSLPTTGTLSTGETVINYNLLPVETLKQEGWLPLVDEPPEYDSETEYLTHDGYDIQEDQVVKLYKIEQIPEQPEPEPDLEQRIQELEEIIDALLGGEDNE